jgi:hypothetical protein
MGFFNEKKFKTISCYSCSCSSKSAEIPYLISMKVLNANFFSNTNPNNFLFIFQIDQNFDSYEITQSVLLLLHLLLSQQQQQQ